MKILFLAHRTPYPPNKGDKIRSFHLLSSLVKKHDVTLLYWVDDPRDLVHTEFLQSMCRGRVIAVELDRKWALCRAALSLLRGQSFTEGYYIAKGFQRGLDNALRGGPFDAVFMFSSATAFYGKPLDANIKIVDFVDVDSDKWGQLAGASRFPISMLYGLEQKRLSRVELEISHWAQWSLFVSSADAELFKKQGSAGNIEVLPNGTDLALLRLPSEQMRFKSLSSRRKSLGAKIIFIGTMNYHPNADAVQYFAEHIFPLIRQKCPQAGFEIVGRCPPRSVMRLDRFEGIKVVGEVADARPYLLRADVSVAPMRIARGVQNKVLEAMAMGIPVVATAGAVQGIEVSDGQEVLIGNYPEEFAAQVIRLLSDADLRKTITTNAWNKMEQVYNWDVVGAKLETLLNTATAHAWKNPEEHEISIARDRRFCRIKA
jgi:sugar transferase (PEP-CTERM/EpsH1 system associated)